MIDILQFCEQGSRCGLDKPFSDRGFVYATNGHILIRVSLNKETEIYANSNPDKALPKIPGDFPGREQINAADVVLPENLSPCIKCEDGFSTTAECPECNSAGTVELDSGHNTYEHKCKTCDGEGEITLAGEPKKCIFCDGTGISLSQPIKVLNCSIQLRYLKMLQNLPACKIFSMEPSKDTFHLNPIGFEFDGGEGMVMPMRVRNSK